MVFLEDNHIEWARRHLERFSHSNFHPRLFEFAAIAHNWPRVKEYLLSLDLDVFSPKSPQIALANKPNGTFRVVHQLDPIDCLVYTALVRGVCEAIEEYRRPVSEGIVFSNRILPDMEGSFFSSERGWEGFIARSTDLADQHTDGYVLVTDITDFYCQIYTHRVQNLVAEAGSGALDEQARAIDRFLLGLNSNTSRGIPVGPQASAVIAELIMASVDNKILTHTNHFVRYVDDIRVFFDSREEAVAVLHDLTQYLYSYHRLVLSGEKTKLLSVKEFRTRYMRDEEREANSKVMARAEGLALGKLDEMFAEAPPYSDDIDYEDEYEKALADIVQNEQFQLLSQTYLELFEKSVSSSLIDFGMLRHILWKAGKYRVRNLATLILGHFEELLPIIREVVVYLDRTMNDEFVSSHRDEFQAIVSSHYARLPFANLWISHLLRNPSFNEVDIPQGYDGIDSIRAKALIAFRKQDTNWVRGYRDGLDVLGPLDKRAVLYASAILPPDEMTSWVSAVAASGDILDRSMASYLNATQGNQQRRKAMGVAEPADPDRHT